MFADFFSNDSGHEPIPVTYGPDGLEVPAELNSVFALSELQAAIHRTKITTPGSDGISAKFFKGLSAHSLQLLLQVYNDIWLTGTIPDEWTMAVVLPILKPHKSSISVDSYRPIALTSVVCKICERMIARRITRFIMEQQLLHHNHLGFLPFRDSRVAVTELHQAIMRARKDKKFILGLSLDLQSAYDSVYIDGLILKCATMGITGRILRWIHRFLVNRRFRVSWRQGLSAYRSLSRGVPQGAVLSPVLFTIFLADLFEAILDGKVQCLVYADDIFLYCACDSILDCRTRLQDALRRISDWCRFWKMTVSAAKSSAVNLSRRLGDCDFHFWIDNGQIKWSSSVKFLGFLFARRGGLHHQVQYLRKKAFLRLNILKALCSKRHGARSFHLLTLASSLFRSLVDYGAPILSAASDSLFKQLEVICTSALRIALGLPKWTPNLVLRKHSGFPTLRLRILDLSVSFWIKHLSLGPWSPLGVRQGLRQVPPMVLEVLDELNCSVDSIIEFCFPLRVRPGAVTFYLSGLPFQSTQMNDRMVSALFLEFIHSFDVYLDLIGTDASKSSSLTAIAGCSLSNQFRYLVHPVNSIFTAEALAIGIAIDELTSPSCPFIIFTDSLSVLTALSSVSISSPRVILWLHSKLQRAASFTSDIILCWVPGHRGIPLNERADCLAKSVIEHDAQLDWISPEDVIQYHKRKSLASLDDQYRSSKYFRSLGDIPSVPAIRSWASSCREDVLLSRTLCRMLITPEILFRFNLCSSNMCVLCQEIDSLPHIIQTCKKYNLQRAHLFSSWVSSLYFCSFSELLSYMGSSPAFRVAILKFLKSTNRF